jgi:CheY-like chemotaxis protein
VLVVNDNARLARSVCAILEEAGYETRVAFDGNEGLGVLAEWRADLVVLDLHMPRFDGWYFLEQLQRTPARRHPIVLVWSVSGADELETARRLGAAQCLPAVSTGPDQLLKAIERLLNQ